MMAMSFWGKHATFDKVMAGSVLVGCIAVVVDADSRGRAPLANETPAHLVAHSSKTAAPFRVSSEQWRQLERDGFLVLDNFLSKQQVSDARQTIQNLDSKGKFHSSPNEQDENNDALVRTDRIYMCRDTEGGLYEIRQHLASFARSVADSEFSGFHHDAPQQYNSNGLNVPQQMQVSIYDGISSNDENKSTSKQRQDSYTSIDDGICSNDENNPKSKQQQDFYTSHLDSSGNDSLFETGLLGWLRSRYLRKRYLTCICYLNPNWKEGDGGCLRLHKNGAESGTFESNDYVDVSPLAGRLVVFSSLHQWHAVLPTLAPRYACSLWLTLDE